MNKSTEIFESHRPRLFRLAYGMLGRVAPAEDAVQEAFIRWQKQDIEQIYSHRAYLSTIVSRICLDKIKSARSQREQYIGPDLPEPVLVSDIETPEEEVKLAESLSMALLVVLDQLTPVQRAVFLLREVFDYDYAAIAKAIDKTESHCRKIAQRAREKINERKPRFEGYPTDQHKLITTFMEAVRKGDLSEIEQMLAKEAILYSDGGGKVAAARKPITGAANITKFLIGIQKGVTQTIRINFTVVNGEPGIMVYLDDQLNNVWSFHIEDDNIQSIYIVLNPEKLDHLKREL